MRNLSFCWLKVFATLFFSHNAHNSVHNMYDSYWKIKIDWVANATKILSPEKMQITCNKKILNYFLIINEAWNRSNCRIKWKINHSFKKLIKSTHTQLSFSHKSSKISWFWHEPSNVFQTQNEKAYSFDLFLLLNHL